MTNSELIKEFGLKVEMYKGEKAILPTMRCGLTQDIIEVIRASKLDIIKEIEQEAAERKIVAEAREAKINAIEGLKEIKAAIDAEIRYHYEFNRRMGNENLSSFSPALPKANVAELKAKYPRATAYLKAISFVNGSNFEKVAAGKTAIEKIINGEDYIKAISDMETEWKEDCEKHIWD